MLKRDKEEGSPELPEDEDKDEEEAIPEVAETAEGFWTDEQVSDKGQGTTDQGMEAGPAGADQALAHGTERVPITAWGREDSVLPDDPEESAAESERILKAAATYVIPTASFSGCAKPAHARRNPPQTAQQGAEMNHPAPSAPRSALRVEEAVAGDRTDQEAGASGAVQRLRRWTDMVPITAWGREDSVLPDDPEESAAESERILNTAATYVNPAIAFSGCAKPALKQGATLPQTGAAGRRSGSPQRSPLNPRLLDSADRAGSEGVRRRAPAIRSYGVTDEQSLRLCCTLIMRTSDDGFDVTQRWRLVAGNWPRRTGPNTIRKT